MDILLASNELDLSMALQILLREEPGADVVGTASEAAGLQALLHASHPDLVLLDWDLPGHPPAGLLAEIKGLDSRSQVIVLGKALSAERAALDSGADFFVLKGDSPRHLLAAVRQAQSRRALATEQLTESRQE